MADAAPRAAGPEELTVLIAAGGGEPDRLLVLGAPANGRVRVREWNAPDWAAAPAEREIATSDALAIFQHAFDARRRLSVALVEVRAWLEGRRR